MSSERNALEQAKAALKLQGLPHKPVNELINGLMSDEEVCATIHSRERDGTEAIDLRKEWERRHRSDS